jgi:hypothetical protein
LEDLLRKLGLSKAQLARELGKKPGTVYRWTDETVPRYVMAYLELKLRFSNGKDQ